MIFFRIRALPWVFHEQLNWFFEIKSWLFAFMRVLCHWPEKSIRNPLARFIRTLLFPPGSASRIVTFKKILVSVIYNILIHAVYSDRVQLNKAKLQ